MPGKTHHIMRVKDNKVCLLPIFYMNQNKTGGINWDFPPDPLDPGDTYPSNITPGTKFYPVHLVWQNNSWKWYAEIYKPLRKSITVQTHCFTQTFEWRKYPGTEMPHILFGTAWWIDGPNIYEIANEEQWQAAGGFKYPITPTTDEPTKGWSFHMDIVGVREDPYSPYHYYYVGVFEFYYEVPNRFPWNENYVSFVHPNMPTKRIARSLVRFTKRSPEPLEVERDIYGSPTFTDVAGQYEVIWDYQGRWDAPMPHDPLDPLVYDTPDMLHAFLNMGPINVILNDWN